MKTVLCGDMEFGHFSVNGGEKTPMCIIHRVEDTMEVADDFDLDQLLDGPFRYSSYIVIKPKSEYEIVYSKKGI